MAQKCVCILNPNIRTFGGGEKHMAYVCKFFEEYFNGNVRIDVFAPYIKSDENDARVPISQENINNHYGMNLTKVREIPLAFEKTSNPIERLKHLFVVESYSRNYDVFVNFKFASTERAFARFNIYSCMFPPRIYKSKNILSNIYKTIIEKKFYKTYDVFISNSVFTNAWLKKYWPGVKKSTVIYPPVFNNADLKGRYDEKKKKNIILSVGRFFVRPHSKKQLEMVNFFVGNRDKFYGYEYHLVGNVDNNNPEDLSYLKEIKELAEKSGGVFVHEDCPYNELVELYKRAKIFWHATGYGVSEDEEPEKMEHFGITTVEAMSYGAVPVVINKAGQKEIVDHGVSGFKWETERECVDFTTKLAGDEELRKTMAKNARASLDRFSYETFYAKMKSVVDSAWR